MTGELCSSGVVVSGELCSTCGVQCNRRTVQYWRCTVCQGNCAVLAVYSVTGELCITGIEQCDRDSTTKIVLTQDLLAMNPALRLYCLSLL